MLIIEGCDDLGKTTLANKIVDAVCKHSDFPAYYNHMTRPPKSFNFCTDYVERMSKYAVQDRFHLGGIVYHNAIRAAALKWIEGHLLLHHSMVIVLYSNDMAWYEERLVKSERGQMYNIPQMLSFAQTWKIVAENEAIHKDFVYCIDRDEELLNDAQVADIAAHWMDKLDFSLRLNPQGYAEYAAQGNVRGGYRHAV